MLELLTKGLVSTQGEPQGIGTTLRDTLREIFLLTSLSLSNFLLVEITLIEFGMQTLEIETLDNVYRVNDVSEGLAHFPPMSVTNHGMAENFFERHLPSQVNTEQDHASNPEEEDIPSGLKHGRRIELAEVGSLLGWYQNTDGVGNGLTYLIGPAHDTEWPETRGEPGIKNVLILL